MPSIATLEELTAVLEDLELLKKEHPQPYDNFAALFRKHRKVGYKNVCKMLLGEATPEKLKGIV